MWEIIIGGFAGYFFNDICGFPTWLTLILCTIIALLCGVWIEYRIKREKNREK